jgi:hypothetical protein
MKILSLILVLLFSSSVYADDLDAELKKEVVKVAKTLCEVNRTSMDQTCRMTPVQLTTTIEGPNVIQKAVIHIINAEGAKEGTLTFEIFDGRIMSVNDECHYCA